MKTQTYLSVVAACALAAPTMAQSPAGGSNLSPGAPVERSPQESALTTEVLYDSLFVVDGGSYDTFNGDALGGLSEWGTVHDLRLADDFYVNHEEGFTITRATADYLTFNGTRPVAMYVRVYGDNGGVPGEVPVHEKLVTSSDISVTPFIDNTFGYQGLRIECENLYMPLGGESTVYWISIQPVHTGTNGDWYYFVRDTTLSWISPTAGRDGELGDGGYGTTAWTDMSALGWGGGYGSMRLEGHRGRLTLHAITPGLAGQNNSVEAHGCDPGARVVLYYSLNPGTTTLSSCPGMALNLQNAISGGPATADGSGVARWTGPVGSGMRGRTGYHQAVDTSNCGVSAVMAWTYPN